MGAAETPWDASAYLDAIVEHGDEMGHIANARPDDLRDVVALAAARLRVLASAPVVDETLTLPPLQAFPDETAFPWPANEDRFAINVHDAWGGFLFSFSVPGRYLADAMLALLNRRALRPSDGA